MKNKSMMVSSLNAKIEVNAAQGVGKYSIVAIPCGQFAALNKLSWPVNQMQLRGYGKSVAKKVEGAFELHNYLADVDSVISSVNTEKTVLFGGLYSNFYIIGDNLYYIESTHDRDGMVNFVRSDLDGSNKETIRQFGYYDLETHLSGGDSYEFYIEGNVVAYAANDTIYKMNTDGSNNTELYRGNYDSFYFENGKIIVETSDGVTREFAK